MCRFVVVLGRFSNAREVLANVGNSLVKAASMDPYGKKFLNEERHNDGWGVLLVNVASSSAVHHRSVRAIFMDDPMNVIRGFLNNINNNDNVLMMMHARAASTGTPKNIFSTHPVRAVTINGLELYMIHNGSFYRDDIAREASIDGDYASRFNDTYIANLALARQVRDDITRDDLGWLLRFIKTGANLGIALIREDSVILIVGSYYRALNDDRREAREAYYKLYQCEVPGGFVYASSTVIDFYKPNMVTNCHGLGNGEYHKYHIQANNDVQRIDTWRF